MPPIAIASVVSLPVPMENALEEFALLASEDAEAALKEAVVGLPCEVLKPATSRAELSNIDGTLMKDDMLDEVTGVVPRENIFRGVFSRFTCNGEGELVC